MNRYKVNINNGKQVDEIVNILNNNKIKAVFETVIDNVEYRTTANTCLGGLATLDWKEVWLKTDTDIKDLIKDFIVEW